MRGSTTIEQSSSDEASGQSRAAQGQGGGVEGKGRTLLSICLPFFGGGNVKILRYLKLSNI